MASAFNSLLNAFYAFLGTAAVHEHNMDCVSLGFSSPDKIKFFLMRPYCFETECNALLKKDLLLLPAIFHGCDVPLLHVFDIGKLLDEIIRIDDDRTTIGDSRVLDDR